VSDQIIASRYRVVRELGRGGMGVVYLVEHVRTGDQLALKLLYGQGARNAQVIERFKREARASARIKSEHIVKVVDADVAPELEGAPFLVMELLNGTDLQKQLETNGRLPPDQALQVLTQAARALDKSHQMGIVHRDLKPENLFIHHREDGSTILKILDFGISKIISGSDGASDMTGAGMTSTGAVMGTPLYMSPEQARGRVNEIGPTTDVWAMGLISLQLLTGEIYWRVNTVAELMSHILSEPFYPPLQRWNWLPPGLDAWFAHSCARDPKQRFQSVGQQIQALGVTLGMRSAVSALPEAPANWPQAVGSSPATPTGPALEGARTTTSAIARSRSGEGKRSRAPLFIVASLVVLGGGGVAAYELRPHGTTTASSTASAPTASAPPAALSTLPPAASSVALVPLPTVPEAGVTAATVATTVPTQHGGRPQPAAPQPQHPVVPATPAAAPTPPPMPVPTPPPATTSHTFNPAAP
jgi:eukaryotic-like serine/threonine-protein kinase